MAKSLTEYEGFELGPIRPPSEAYSLLVRITRNCPWNQCSFCGLYKGKKFSLRPKEHILKDIDIIKKCIDVLKETDSSSIDNRRSLALQLEKTLGANNDLAYRCATSWYMSGMKSIFLQDANSLVIKPNNLVEILNYIKASFPSVERITSYARSHTIARMKDADLKRIADAGLNRIHIGMETASDKVLELVKKGVDKTAHVIAGQKVKKAGIELSEYYMPGLGGNEYFRESALETADALNQINPDFIRIRTLAIPDHTLLHKDYEEGIFTRTNDIKMIQELLILFENLHGITSIVKSDHILNLIPEVEGQLPEDKEKIISALEWFIGLTEEEQMIFRIGRRTGIMSLMKDLSQPAKRERVKKIIEHNNISTENADEIVEGLMKRFI